VGSCDVIDEAIARYHKLAFPLYDPDTYSDSPPTLTTLTIDVKEGCNTKFPQLNMDESYGLTVDESKDAATLSANEVWGALRGLETFSQLIFQPVRNQYRIRSASIQDQPRFPHRGTLIDTGRHFLSLSIILQHLDVMSQNKMNVLHWHIVDSESFPYTSAKFPDMSLKGAYTPAHIYSIADMKKVMNYARLRGIRVIPEFDSPGHSGSWGASISNLLPQCYNSEGKIDQLPNIMDPTLPANFKFLSEFFEEALTLFGEKFMHFGGDEVEWDMEKCWFCSISTVMIIVPSALANYWLFNNW
ncbi:glycosyl hydrolase family 20, catalytic domain protein, partial [Ostertagia ostertagi]